jgi:hypothetical protein
MAISCEPALLGCPDVEVMPAVAPTTSVLPAVALAANEAETEVVLEKDTLFADRT